jgi:Mg2+/citrate symporter
MTPEFLNVALVVVLAVIVGTVMGVEPCMVLTWWLNRRERRRWQMQQQLRDMEQAIREEGLPDEERERLRRYREREAAIKQEARLRMGLPEEEPHR